MHVYKGCEGVDFDREKFETNESLEMQHEIVVKLFKITDEYERIFYEK